MNVSDHSNWTLTTVLNCRFELSGQYEGEVSPGLDSHLIVHMYNEGVLSG